MISRPRLTRSIPFWLLIAASLASLGAGAYLLLDRLGTMDARLTDGTATNSDVYVGQTWAVLGAVLVGAGVVGLALALTVGALRSLVPVSVAPMADAAAAGTEPDGAGLADDDTNRTAAADPTDASVADDVELGDADRVPVSR